MIRDLQSFSQGLVWQTCCRVSGTESSSLIAELERFDWRGVGRESPRFGNFLVWLYKLVIFTYDILLLIHSLLSRANEITHLST